MNRTLPPIDKSWNSDPFANRNRNHTRYTLPPIRDNDSSSLLSTSPDMAAHFTLFSQLIPELRLMIWRLALPTFRGNKKLPYPYQKGCWVFEDLGLEPDRNGEDLHIRFDTTRLKSVHVALPLYLVNREARDVTLKWLREQRMTIQQNLSGSICEAIRPFDPRHDTMFVSSTKIKKFVKELLKRPLKRDMRHRHFSTSNPALPRLAVTPVGLQILNREPLRVIFAAAGTIETILVVDDASVSSLQALESAGGGVAVELADQPVARVKWSYLGGVGEVSGDDERGVARLKEYVEGFDTYSYAPNGFELEIQLVNLA